MTKTKKKWDPGQFLLKSCGSVENLKFQVAEIKVLTADLKICMKNYLLQVLIFFQNSFGIIVKIHANDF